MRMGKMGVFFVLCQVSVVWAVDISRANPALTQVSRQCIKIWCLIRNLVENAGDDATKEKIEETVLVDHLDTLLCRVMKVRDTLSHYGTNPVSDRQTAEYIDSSLDCIGQYTYDLKERYPCSWSDVIQEQIFRTQEAYVNHVLPRLTK